jgi:hypothetical protein
MGRFCDNLPPVFASVGGVGRVASFLETPGFWKPDLGLCMRNRYLPLPCAIKWHLGPRSSVETDTLIPRGGLGNQKLGGSLERRE